MRTSIVVVPWKGHPREQLACRSDLDLCQELFGIGARQAADVTHLDIERSPAERVRDRAVDLRFLLDGASASGRQGDNRDRRL
jgi:hypothetical protein